MSETSEPAEHSPGRVSDHSRHWQENHYVYPVISRRSRGLSIGINLNPDTVCNFDCIYCQVDRNNPDRGAKVDLGILEVELDDMLAQAVSGNLFTGPRFRDLPDSLSAVRDVAFSGDGEPTTCPKFLDAVRLVARLKASHGLEGAKIVLITNACYLKRPEVRQALEVMDANHGEIWAKLDAGTEEYYRRINRPHEPLHVVLDNILDAARVRPLVIQSLWMQIEGRPPPQPEIRAFADRLNEIQSADGRIKFVQLYTIARKPAEDYVTPLSRLQVEHIAALVRHHTGANVETYFAPHQ